MEDIQVISSTLFDAVTEKAETSVRRRMNYNFHAGAADNPHRMLNVLLAGTYIQPHRHLEPPKAESFLVLEGEADVFVFDDAGTVTARYLLGRDGLWGVDLPAGTWHTILPRTERAVCYEVKPGPWMPATDKEFAPWAPREGDPAAAEYAKRLMAI
jgi:cupin fold WbuC family metalloprotein